MPPNLDDNLLNRPSSDLILFMAPLLPNGPVSDDDSDEEIAPELEEEDIVSDLSQILIPLEQNLRALLVQVTGTEDLDRVTQVKLRVIARDVPLQHFSVYIPALRELILDGSVVSSLRDLGCGLKNLKILRVNRCGIDCLDNMLGLESLEELYAANNAIENCMPLAFLSNIKTVDLRSNQLKNMTRTLAFLTLCEKLEHIYLEGNAEIWQFPKYRQTVKSLLPRLRSLDGITYTEEESNTKASPEINRELQQYLARKSEESGPTPRNTLSDVINGAGAPRSRPVAPNSATGFTITFPPKVFLDKSTNNKQ
ncbi:hypothetical protein Zmor_010683 [Zophobas morio]|uniref:Leucine-rich repeat-containing protein 56 n=1 Tax=Zophobas morio TaxID=2755281 RepID=A0AA38MK44_9CUCU|nr:hypothetical protein Zmor_010683 [Zophobas morio]